MSDQISDLEPLPESVMGHVMWYQYIHVDGRECAYHSRLDKWVTQRKPITPQSCLRPHFPYTDGLVIDCPLCGKRSGGHHECPQCHLTFNIEILGQEGLKNKVWVNEQLEEARLNAAMDDPTLHPADKLERVIEVCRRWDMYTKGPTPGTTIPLYQAMDMWDDEKGCLKDG